VPRAHVFRDSRLTNLDAELQQFTMHPRRAPARVRLGHLANQGPDVGGHRRSPEATPTLPGPPQLETASVPRDDGLRLDNDERRPPSGPEAREQDPEPSVRLREPRPPRAAALQHRQLVSQCQDFELKRGARPCQRSQSQEERVHHRDHGREAYLPSAVTSTAAGRTDFSVGTPHLGPASYRDDERVRRRPRLGGLLNFYERAA
jgi:hypothetical protein